MLNLIDRIPPLVILAALIVGAWMVVGGIVAGIVGVARALGGLA